LEREGDRVKAKTQIADATKSLKKLEEEEKETGQAQSGKKEKLKEMIAKNEEKLTTTADEGVAEEAEVNKEKEEKIKDLKKSLADVEQKQAKEVKALEAVRQTIASKVDEPKAPEPVYTDKHEPTAEEKAKAAKLDTYKAAVAQIEKEEEAKEAFLEARAAEKAAIPKNPVVEASEAAQEAADEAAFAKRKADYEAEEAEKAAAEAKKKASAAKAAAARSKAMENAEVWTSNMPEHYLEGYIQTQVNDIRRQLAQVNAHDDDSDSDSSDSDDE